MPGQPSEVTTVPDLEALSEAAAQFIVQCASDALARSGRFTIVLAGGSTPRCLYELLAAAPWKARVDWARCQVFWGDERMVPPEDPNSNFGLAQSALLAYVPIPPAHVHRARTETGDASIVAAAYEAELREFFALTPSEEPRFDLVLLGLGADGHVASLFPGAPTLQETRRLVMPSLPGRLPPAVDRVTLTLPVLNRSRAIVFLVSGSEKASVLSRVLSGDTDLPAGRVNPVGGVLRWFVDEAAMGGAAGMKG